MSSTAGIKRKRQGGLPKKAFSRPKKSKRAAAYHSSSDDDVEEPIPDGGIVPDEVIASDDDTDDDSGVQLPNLVEGMAARGSHTRDQAADDDSEEAEVMSGTENASQSSGSEDQDEDDDLEDVGNHSHKPRKRNDPTQFATSISKILSSKLTKDKRSDPVLSRSKNASDISKGMTEDRLEAKARRKMRDDKKAALSKGREEDVLGLNREDVSTGAVAEEEKQLRKTAQRGVVKLFNAVRAAQVKGEEAAKLVQVKGVIGSDRRQEHVNEMSKKGFLDLLVDGER